MSEIAGRESRLREIQKLATCKFNLIWSRCGYTHFTEDRFSASLIPGIYIKKGFKTTLTEIHVSLSVCKTDLMYKRI